MSAGLYWLTLLKLAWPIAAAVLLSGCGSPTDPGPLVEGVAVYADPNFRGLVERFTADVVDLDDIDGGCFFPGGVPGAGTFDWDDCISSIEVAPGWTVTLYDDPKYKGKSVTITSDTADLDAVPGPCGGDWDDCASSIRVSRR